MLCSGSEIIVQTGEQMKDPQDNRPIPLTMEMKPEYRTRQTKGKCRNTWTLIRKLVYDTNK
jgi:hypothetical protein